MKKALFLDRDGTLNEMVYDDTHGLFDSPRRPEQVRLVAGAAGFMAEARRAGYALIVITNQPGLAKGTMTPADLEAVNARLAELLAAQGARWDALYFCPHHPTGDPGRVAPYVTACDCRKPRPGMLIEAAREHGLDLAASWMIGDGVNDVQAGHAAGCRTALITSVKPEQLNHLLREGARLPDIVAGGYEGLLARLAFNVTRASCP
jgi:D-glycero-D-manno-heptose 1,7-bisphosphate phosphatase